VTYQTPSHKKIHFLFIYFIYTFRSCVFLILRSSSRPLTFFNPISCPYDHTRQRSYTRTAARPYTAMRRWSAQHTFPRWWWCLPSRRSDLHTHSTEICHTGHAATSEGRGAASPPRLPPHGATCSSGCSPATACRPRRVLKIQTVPRLAAFINSGSYRPPLMASIRRRVAVAAHTHSFPSKWTL
jgi:hypothetical protein